MPYLGWSAKAFSLVKQPVSGVPQDLPAYDSPLWHNVLFQDQHKQKYYCSKLIRMNVLMLGALLEDDTLVNYLAPSWQPIYEVGLAGISGRPPDGIAPRLLLNQNTPRRSAHPPTPVSF